MSVSIDRRRFLLGSSAFGALAVMHPYSAFAAAGQAHLRIMETTDIHVNLLPYDYYADKPNDTMGLARTATIIRSIRAEATNSMLIDNGDLLQGSPMGDYIAYEKGMKDGDVHPIMKGMNLLGYECSTFGNHEFNYGLPFFDKVIAGANFPFVCANLIRGTVLASDPRDDELYAKPYMILDKTVTDGDGKDYPIKIGIIGFVPPQIMIWDSKNLVGNVMTRDIVEAAKAWVPEIKEAGADIVIALSHSGIDANKTDLMENASLYLGDIDGLDAIFTGHQHLVFPGGPSFDNLDGVDNKAGTLMGKPAVMGGFWGSHMGLIDLLLERDGNAWQVVSATSEARPIYQRKDGKIVATVADYEKIDDALKADHEATLAYVRRPVGKTAAPLYSYFALVADDPSVQIVSNAQTWYIAQMMKGTKWEGLPILSAAAPFKAGGRGGPDYYTDVPVGEVAIKNVSDLYLYPNTVRAVEITGAQVKEWLEMSAGIFNQIAAGQGRPAADQPRFPELQFRRHRRGHLQDRRLAASEIRPQGRRHEFDGEPHRRSPVRRQADRSGAEVHRRHQQLPRRRRRQLPRHQRQRHRLRGPRHQPRHHRALYRREGHHRPQGGRELVAGAGCRRLGHLPVGAEGQGPPRRRQGHRAGRPRRRRLRQLPHQALSLVRGFPGAGLGPPFFVRGPKCRARSVCPAPDFTSSIRPPNKRGSPNPSIFCVPRSSGVTGPVQDMHHVHTQCSACRHLQDRRRARGQSPRLWRHAHHRPRNLG